MLGLLADVNAEGHLDALLTVCKSDAWIDVWNALGVKVYELSDLGLLPTVADDALWRACQLHGVVLVTSNRNQKGAGSLGATIARENTVQSLPVVTFADADKVVADRAYCEAAAIGLIDILMRVEEMRGSGRLWIP